jgi:hypothetical protein
MRRLIKNASYVAAMAAVMACSNTSFTGGDNKKAANALPKPTPPTSTATGTVTSTGTNVSSQQLNLSCPNGQGTATLNTAVTGAQNTTVTLVGEFCGVSPSAAPSKLNVLFIIDWSGSMRDNDPDILGTCGRLQAAQTIVQKLQSQFQQGDGILIGVQPFGATAQQGIAPVALSQFSAALTDQVFCRDDAGDTNYDSAFRAATQTLQGLNNGGANVVYFITDGVPDTSGDGQTNAFANPNNTNGGFNTGFINGFGTSTDTSTTTGGVLSPEAQQLQQAYAQGLASAQALRAVPNTTLNALILTDTTGQNNNVPGFTPPAPNDYLTQIAGDASHAKVAANASDLAAQIQQFQTPQGLVLNADSGSGNLNTATLGTQVIKLASVSQEPGKQGVWQFTTEPFKLLGAGTSATENDVTISIKGGDGKTYTATAVINFTVKGN